MVFPKKMVRNGVVDKAADLVFGWLSLVAVDEQGGQQRPQSARLSKPESESNPDASSSLGSIFKRDTGSNESDSARPPRRQKEKISDGVVVLRNPGDGVMPTEAK
jgi:hypothetical protein